MPNGGPKPSPPPCLAPLNTHSLRKASPDTMSLNETSPCLSSPKAVAPSSGDYTASMTLAEPLGRKGQPLGSPPTSGLFLSSCGSLGAAGGGASTSGGGGTGSRRPTLLERRNNKSNKGLSLSHVAGLSMDAIGDTTREIRVPPQESTPKAICRGWASSNLTTVDEDEADMSKSAEAFSFLDGELPPKALKLACYNILASRLVSTDRYPGCPPAVLGEDYRVKLLKEEIKLVAPSILLMEEISVEVYEKSLGEHLRNTMNYYSEFVVITDAAGEPRCRPKETHVRTTSTPLLAAPRRSATSSPASCVGERGPSFLNANDIASPVGSLGKMDDLQRRTEMDGVAIFFDKSRFSLMEKVPIHFNAIAQRDYQLNPYEKKKLQQNSHNVALVLVLRDHMLPSQVLIVAVVHLIWQRTEAQLWQSHHLLEVMEGLKHKYAALGEATAATRPPSMSEGALDKEPLSPPAQLPASGSPPGRDTSFSADALPHTKYKVSCIIGGDFNVERHSQVFRYLREGTVPADAPVMGYWRGEEIQRVGSRSSLPSIPTTPPSQPGAPETDGAPHQPFVPTTPSPSKQYFRRRHSSCQSSPAEDTTLSPAAPLSKKKRRSLSSYAYFSASGRQSTGRTQTGTAAGKEPNATLRSSSRRMQTIASNGTITSLMECKAAVNAPPPTELPPVEPPPTSANDSSEVSPTAFDVLSKKASNAANALQVAQLTRQSSSMERSTNSTRISSSNGGNSRSRLSPMKTPVKQGPPQTTHELRFVDAYENYCLENPQQVSAINPSTNMEGKVLDHVLFEDDYVRCTKVLRLGEMDEIPNKDVPSDHYMVGAVFLPHDGGY